MWITSAGPANWFFVLARTDASAKTSKFVSYQFLVYFSCVLVCELWIIISIVIY